MTNPDVNRADKDLRLDPKTEQVLHGGLVVPPVDFTEVLMQRIADTTPQSEHTDLQTPERERRPLSLASVATAVAVAIGAAAAAMQSIAFVFGLWAASALA